MYGWLRNHTVISYSIYGRTKNTRQMALNDIYIGTAENPVDPDVKNDFKYFGRSWKVFESSWKSLENVFDALNSNQFSLFLYQLKLTYKVLPAGDGTWIVQTGTWIVQTRTWIVQTGYVKSWYLQ